MPERLRSHFTTSEEAAYQEICKQAAAPEADRKGLSQALTALWQAVAVRLEQKLSFGPMLGAFWKAYPTAKDKRSEDKGKSNPQREEELRELTLCLPYPLGYKLAEFLREDGFFQRGEMSVNFLYQIASLNGLALRFLAILCICEYVERAKAPDTRLNTLLVESLQTPADGTWKTLLDRFTSEDSLKKTCPFIQAVAEAIRTKQPSSLQKKGVSPTQALQDLVGFRNLLLHGTRSFEEKEILEAIEKIKLIYHALSFLRGYELRVLQPPGSYRCTGLLPTFVLETEASLQTGEDGSLKPLFFPRKSEAAPSEPRPSEGGKEREDKGKIEPLLLYPLLHFCKQETQDTTEETGGMGLSADEIDELFFFNGVHEEQIEYISYRYARSLHHRNVGVPYADYLGFWRKIPVTLLPSKARIDFSEMADFHAAWFVGRQEILAAIFQFFLETPRPYGIIKAMAGMGKTALFAKLYRSAIRKEGWPSEIFPVWHFCSSLEGRDHPVVFLRSLLAQIDAHLGETQREYPTSLDLLKSQMTETFRSLRERLPSGHRIVLIVDALDEGLPSHGTTLFSIPGVLPPPSSLPPSISVLISYRVDEHGQNKMIEDLLHLSPATSYAIPGCDPLSGLAWNEMLAMAQKALGKKEIRQKTFFAIWKTASQDAEISERKADPFVLRFLLDGLREGRLDPERPETVPGSLTAIFDQFWNLLPASQGYFLQKFLGMLSFLDDLGSDELFAQIVSIQQGRGGLGSEPLTSDEVAQRRSSINKFLVFSGDRYRLFHSRFQEYVRRRFHPRDQAHTLLWPLVEYGLSALRESSHYALRRRIHLLRQVILHTGLEDQLRQRARTILWKEMQRDDFFLEKFQTIHRTDLLLDDFQDAIEVFRPVYAVPPPSSAEESSKGQGKVSFLASEVSKTSETPDASEVSKTSETPEASETSGEPLVFQSHDGLDHGALWSGFSRTFYLAMRCRQVISRVLLRSRQRLTEAARHGDIEQVIRIAFWSSEPYQRLWHLALGAAWMADAGYSPSRLWNAFQDLGQPAFSKQETPFLLRLLKKAQAPVEVIELLKGWERDEAN